MRLFLQNTFATSWCLTHSPNHPATGNSSVPALAFLNTLTFSWTRHSTATRDSCQDLERCRTDGFLPDGRLFPFTFQIYVKYSFNSRMESGRGSGWCWGLFSRLSPLTLGAGVLGFCMEGSTSPYAPTTLASQLVWLQRWWDLPTRDFTLPPRLYSNTPFIPLPTAV